MSYLYVIGPKDHGPQKIGFSNNVQQRLKSLQTGHPSKLYIHHTVEVDDHKVKLLERVIHKEIKHHKSHGEWFNLTPETAKAELEFAMIRYSEDPLIKYYV